MFFSCFRKTKNYFHKTIGDELMKKILGILLSFFMIITIVAACSGSGINEDDVLDLVKKYKTEQYTIPDPANTPTPNEIADKVKGYLSKDALKKQQANRTFGLAPDLAKKTNKSLTFEEITLEKQKENEDGTINYKYTMKLKLYDKQSSEILKVDGQLSVSNDNGLVITRDWENKRVFEKYFF